MDYLEDAKSWIESADDAWLDGEDGVALANTQFAIARALIALVDRLDKINRVGLPVEVHK